jgi:predicted dehydrogenase
MTLQWAILGTGFISNKVIDGIKRSNGSHLHTIAGRNPDALAAFQTEHGIPNIASIDAALSDPEVDAVYIGLPNHVHHTVTIAASKAGKAVLSEKSLTTTMQDAKALVDQVQDNSFFVEGLMYLAHPLLHRFEQILRDGRLGELRSVNGYYNADIAAFVNPKGMGTLYNLGCYPVSLLQLTVQTMCGEVTFEDRQMAGFGTLNSDDTICDAAVSVRFADGTLASLQSTDSYGTAFAFSVQGTKGELRFVTNPWQPIAGRSHMQWCPYEGEVEDIYVDDEFDAFYHQIKLVERHVTAGDAQAARPSPRLQDSLEIMGFLTDWERIARG